MCACACVCVCVSERERERERENASTPDNHHHIIVGIFIECFQAQLKLYPTEYHKGLYFSNYPAGMELAQT